MGFLSQEHFLNERINPMVSLNPHLSFDAQCDEAFKFYERVLGGKITFKMTWGEMPGNEQFPKETHHLIMHVSMSINNQTLMGADSPPGHYQRPQGIHISLQFKDKSQGEKTFKALSEEGTVQMPFQQTFWSPGFGMCADRFGIPWMINCEAAEVKS
jgi:PhnB protein